MLQKAFALPNPNPQAFAIELSAPATQIEIRIYTRAMVCIWVGWSPPEPSGWSQIPLPATALLNMGNGLYFASLTAYQGSSPSSRLTLPFMLLR